jgi:hypothetical protein
MYDIMKGENYKNYLYDVEQFTARLNCYTWRLFPSAFVTL